MIPTDALTHPTDAAAVTHALVEAAAAAGHAPSIHNTQPWRWRLAGNTLDLYLERSRVLDVTDPDTRLATLSCGAALHHARVSLAAQGWHVEVARMPDPEDPDHLARLSPAGRVPVELPSLRRLQTVRLRRTDRRPVTGEPVATADLQAVAADVEAEDTWLHVLTSDQVLDLAGAADHAQRTEVGETAWQTELAYWTGGTRPAGTGIPDAAIPDRTIRTTVPGRNFGHPGALPISSGQDRAAIFAMLYGRTDELVSWLRAGEALSAGWLTATELGVSLLPFSAPIEVISTRQAMRVIIASTGYPYLVVRLGHFNATEAGPPHAPRLPTDQIIDRA
ncbi:Acg family FMN-binding oxidoreductase [Dactylosporangium cerinum]|uniref:Acg family FMN-binding oxidoreductase n=1 Tax=Dactylosporangium cerinum TaxID=1434730 RepID=A0ABV9VNC6_9ACTN